MADPRSPLLLLLVVLGAVAGGSVVTASAVAVSAAPAASAGQDASSTVLTLLNEDRAAAGLRALRVDSRLWRLAADRAAALASTGELSHDSYGGQVWNAVAGTGVNAYTSGEVVGMTTAEIGPDAARYIYDLWKASQMHWALMTSSTYNYLGIGFALRPSSGATYASIVFAEAPDVTAPAAWMTRAVVNRTTVSFGWSGRDTQLQTHTAGLRNFDVEYRVDGGPWKTLRNATTSTSIVLSARPRGHTYGIRVRDRDRRNNVSGWSAARTVRVP